MKRKKIWGLVLMACWAAVQPGLSDRLSAQENFVGGVNYSSLDAQKVVVLGMAVDGIILHIAHDPQDFVKKGDLLLQLDPNRMALEVENLREQLELNRQVDILQARIRLNFALDNLDIVKKLYEIAIGESRAASEKEYKEALQSKEITALEMQRVIKQGKILEYRLRQNQKILEQHSLRAPLNGVVVPLTSVKNLESRNLKPYQVGEAVQSSMPVMAMMKVDRLQVRRTLPVNQLKQVQLGQQVWVSVDREDNPPVSARVVYISPTIDYSTQRFEIKVELDNPLVKNRDQLPPGGYPYQFRPGMRAWVNMSR